VREVQSKEEIDFLLSTTVSSVRRRDALFSVKLGSDIEVDARAVVLAVGFDPFDPAAQRNATMLGRHPDILSALEIERMLREEGRITRRSDHATPRKVAFIQCVGSRSRRFGSPECSRVCCPYAVRIARRIKWQQPDSEVSIFHMDLQGIRKVAQDMYGEFAEELNLIRGIPSDALAEADGTITLKYELTDSGDIARGSYEMVILSVGICPNREAKSLAEAFGIELDELGFMKPISVLEPNVSTVEGVFMAGTCSGPRDIRESIAHGKAAAYAALEWIKRKDS
jgi:heterodisulfide reductase subunit A